MSTDPVNYTANSDMAGQKRGTSESAIPDIASVDPRNSKRQETQQVCQHQTKHWDPWSSSHKRRCHLLEEAVPQHEKHAPAPRSPLRVLMLLFSPLCDTITLPAPPASMTHTLSTGHGTRETLAVTCHRHPYYPPCAAPPSSDAPVDLLYTSPPLLAYRSTIGASGTQTVENLYLIPQLATFLRVPPAPYLCEPTSLSIPDSFCLPSALRRDFPHPIYIRTLRPISFSLTHRPQHSRLPEYPGHGTRETLAITCIRYTYYSSCADLPSSAAPINPLDRFFPPLLAYKSTIGACGTQTLETLLLIPRPPTFLQIPPAPYACGLASLSIPDSSWPPSTLMRDFPHTMFSTQYAQNRSTQTTPQEYNYIESYEDKFTPAVLVLVPPSDNKIEIDKKLVYTAFATEAAYVDVEQLPSKGVTQYGKTGSLEIHSNYRDVNIIRAACKGTLLIVTPNGNVTCKLLTRKVESRPSLANTFTREFTDSESLHVMVVLKSRWEHINLQPSHIRAYWENAGFLVLSCNRPAYRPDGASIGDAGAGSMIHANVRSADLTLALQRTRWPPYQVTRGVDDSGNTWQHPITYKIAEHDAVSGIVCLSNAPCHRYFKPFEPDVPSCRCDEWSRQREQKALQTQEQQRVRKSIAAAQSELRVDKSQLPCRHFDEGRCNITKCKFQHTGAMLTAAPVTNCRLKNNGKQCEARDKCKFAHPWGIALKKAKIPSLHIPRKHLRGLCCVIKDTVYTYTLHPRKIWNSTLGYPGEGPSTYTPTTCTTFNARGLCRGGRLSALLSEANRRGIHILLIQEHNLKKKHAVMIADVCRRHRFHANVAFVPALGTGGAAVFISRDSPSIDCSDAVSKCALGGGVASTTVMLHGHRTPLVSVYAPVHPHLRKVFFSKLPITRLVTTEAIVGGDWNCVPDTTLDVASKSKTPYPNSHSGLLETYVTGKGLTDVFRLVKGSLLSYSRTSATINTRIDRIYARKYNSHWRWIHAEYDPTLFRSEWASDHIALIVTLETAISRAPSPTEAKIDPNIYNDSVVRSKVRQLWRSAYDCYPEDEYDRSTAWDKAKQVVATYLLEVTNSRRRAKITLKKFVASTLKYHVSATATSGPSQRNQDIKKKLEQQLKHSRDPEVKTGWWAYISSLQQEVSSKIFYRKFKAKFSNSDISSLHVTPDWYDPEKKLEPVNTNIGITSQLTAYYKWLFRRRDSINPKPLLNELNKRKLSKKSRDSLEKHVSEKEVRKTIRTLGRGKSPGPDLLTAEFYITFEDLVAADLAAVLTEAHSRHRLPHTTKQGIIKVLYKKGDPREVRNYRPLTMLNTDYKILTKLLALRIAGVLDSIVSAPQLGFVPGRVITEASHLVKLVQAYLDETDEDGLLIALDFEKAFDSISWDYLHQSIEALGFGPNISRWYHILYNHCDPQERVIQANGTRGDTFPLNSGIPQGCPLSPITFLFISEGLTRLILNDERYKGIHVGSIVLKLSQFADDTLLFLRSYAGLKRAWELINIYTLATAMCVNVKKTEGIRCGSLKRKPHLISAALCTDLIKWVKDGEWVRLLGIPFWESYNENLFFEQLYLKAKAKLACWRHHFLLTQIGRGMLANTMFFSLFRYWGQCMVIPSHINTAIIDDSQALIWVKRPEFDPDEIGTTAKFRRWMKDQAQYGTRVLDLGLSIMDWASHVRALRTRWLFRYCDSTRGQYKDVLDQWFARYHEGRGAMFTTLKESELTKSLTYRPSALPRFWKLALADLRTLTIDRIYPNRCISTEEARAMPVWDNPLYTIAHRMFVDSWRFELTLNSVKDSFKAGTGEEFTDSDLEQYIEDAFGIRPDGTVHVSRGKVITVRSLIHQWHRILNQIPNFISSAARGKPTMYEQYGQGSRMLRNWVQGWQEGSGIPNSSRTPGISDPIPTPSQHTPGAGLGFGPRRKPDRKQESADRRSRFKAIILQGTTAYGTYSPITEDFHVYSLTTRGRLEPTTTHHYIRSHEIREILFSNGGVLGIAESTFPHPAGWTVAGTDCDLSRPTVKKLTTAFRLPLYVEPSCKAVWERILGVLDWNEIGRKYRQRLLTPPDFMTHYKLILHRALYARAYNRSGLVSPLCRLCDSNIENILHLASCRRLCTLWDRFILLSNRTCQSQQERSKLILLGVTPEGRSLPQALSDFHLVLWKFILINFTLVDLQKQRFIAENVWKGAVRRYVSKANSLTSKILLRQIRAENDNADVCVSNENSILAPLGEIDLHGSISWQPRFAQYVSTL